MLRGEILNQHPPKRPFRRQRWVVCNMLWGKGGSFSVYFLFHLCCWHGREVPCRSNTNSWALLNAISPLRRMENQIIRCSSAEAFVTVKDNAMPLRGWERCSPSSPWTLLAAPPGAPTPNTVSSPRLEFHLPQAGQGRIQCGQDSDRSPLVIP